LEADALFNDHTKKVDEYREKLEITPKDVDILAKKTNSEAFIAKYNLDVKMDAAEKSVDESKIAEKKLKVATLEADVKKVKDAEYKAGIEVSESIKKENAKTEAKTTVPEDPKMAAFNEGIKEMAKKEEEKEEQEEFKKEALKLNANPGIKASEERVAHFDDVVDKYKEERAAFEAKKAEKLAAEKALETKRIKVMSSKNSDIEDYIGSLP